jgi:hypothetical protein
MGVRLLLVLGVTITLALRPSTAHAQLETFAQSPTSASALPRAPIELKCYGRRAGWK